MLLYPGMTATTPIEFEAAKAAVRATDPYAAEGGALSSYFGGNADEVFVIARAGGIEHRWLVTFSDRLDTEGYAIGVAWSIRELPWVMVS